MRSGWKSRVAWLKTRRTLRVPADHDASGDLLDPDALLTEDGNDLITDDTEATLIVE